MKSHFYWEQNIDKKAILKRILDCRKIDKEGKVSFLGQDYRFWLPVLNSSIKSSAAAKFLKGRCIAEALNDTSITSNDYEKFISLCSNVYEKFSSRAKKKFVAIMSVTYSEEPLFKKITDENICMQWATSANSKFMKNALKARISQHHVRQNHQVMEESDNISHILVTVLAYDAYHAHEISTDSFDSLRAILNLFANSNRKWNPFSDLSRPHAINIFRPGPYRTIHHEDGSLATEVFWYEHRWVHERSTLKFKDNNASNFKLNLRNYWNNFQKNSIKEHIRQGLLRYCRALDMHDTEPALLEIWGALENLMGTQNDKYDITINRIVRLFTDQDDARLIAHHLRLRRNYTVHAAHTIRQHEADMILTQGETLVSRALFFCLLEGHRFSDRNELFWFLDLPVDKNLLQRRANLSRFFIEFQER